MPETGDIVRLGRVIMSGGSANPLANQPQVGLTMYGKDLQKRYSGTIAYGMKHLSQDDAAWRRHIVNIKQPQPE